jgi:hypothetical protein
MECAIDTDAGMAEEVRGIGGVPFASACWRTCGETTLRPVPCCIGRREGNGTAADANGKELEASEVLASGTVDDGNADCVNAPFMVFGPEERERIGCAIRGSGLVKEGSDSVEGNDDTDECAVSGGALSNGGGGGSIGRLGSG